MGRSAFFFSVGNALSFFGYHIARRLNTITRPNSNSEATYVKPPDSKSLGAISVLHGALLRMLQNTAAGLNPHAPDKHIHEIRKELKCSRAALRLLRDAFGEAEYRRSNKALRDAAKPLTPIRDAAALADTLGKLARHDRRRKDVQYSRDLRDLLTRNQQANRERLTSTAVRDSARLINQVLRDSRRPIQEPGVAGVIRGLTRAYKRAENAMRYAKRKAADDRLHEWRKQTKYLFNELSLVKSSMRVKS